jgi:nitroimidazol reductase NimA-like FMN-containing flavoprotein (pyridoxamine 5'-phosphate oxidase superfamily)
MKPPEIRSLLESGRKLQVATLGPDGSPHLTTLWYLMYQNLITFRSFTKSQRIVNLRRDARLTVLVEEGDSYDTLRGVMVKGYAQLIDDRATVLEAYGRVAAKYEGGGTSAALDPDALEMLFGRYADKNSVVMVQPLEIVSWDHRKLGGTS